MFKHTDSIYHLESTIDILLYLLYQMPIHQEVHFYTKDMHKKNIYQCIAKKLNLKFFPAINFINLVPTINQNLK